MKLSRLLLAYVLFDILIGYAGLIPLTEAVAAQTTAVSATVIDQNAIPYAGGQVTVAFTPNTASPVYTGGGTFQTSYSAQLDATGSFTLPIPDNTKVAQPSTQWVFNVCAADGTTCFNSTQTISGSSQSLSAALSAVAPNYWGIIRPSALIGPFQLTVSTVSPSEQSTTQAYSSLTTREAEFFVVPNPITVNKISYWETVNTTTGTVKICVYSSNGAAKPIDTTITPTGAAGAQTVTLGAPVTLSPGGYYIITGCATTCSHTVTAGAIETTSTLYGAGTPTGKLPWHGTVTHASGVCNAALGTVTGGTDAPIGFRLDN